VLLAVLARGTTEGPFPDNVLQGQKVWPSVRAVSRPARPTFCMLIELYLARLAVAYGCDGQTY